MLFIDWSNFTDTMVVNGVALMRDICSRGYEAYIVGGAVRDLAMGDNSMHDIDIATNMPIDMIKEAYTAIEYGGGERHGTVIVRFNGNNYELTQFRTEGTYSDNRRPDSVEFVQSFEEDTKRRDFTINSMGVSCDGDVIDYHGGLDDITYKELNTVGISIDRFTEDALRIMRAIRFTARFGFTMSNEVYNAICELKDTVLTTSMERIRDELLKIISYGSDAFSTAIKLMYKTGLLGVILPEITYSPRMRYHIEGISDRSKSEIVYLSILAYALDKIDIILLGKRLKLDNYTIDGLVYINSNLHNYGQLHSLDRQKALKLVNSVYFDELRIVYIATRNSYDEVPYDVRGIDYEIANIRNFNEISAFETHMSAELLKYITPGPAFGKYLQEIRDWVFAKFDKDTKLVSIDELHEFVLSKVNSLKDMEC